MPWHGAETALSFLSPAAFSNNPEQQILNTELCPIPDNLLTCHIFVMLNVLHDENFYPDSFFAFYFLIRLHPK
jgi:hypothetical protein